MIPHVQRTQRRTWDGPAWRWQAGAVGSGAPRWPPSGGRIPPAIAMCRGSGDGGWGMRPVSPDARGQRWRRWGAVRPGQRPARSWPIVGRVAKPFAPWCCASARWRRRGWTRSWPNGSRRPERARRRGGPASRRRGAVRSGPWRISRARERRSPACPCCGPGGGRWRLATCGSQRSSCAPRAWSVSRPRQAHPSPGACPAPSVGGSSPIPPRWPRS
jgi:hypothetical protein